MIKLEHTQTYGWEAAIRGMRNPMNSWEKSDSDLQCDVDCGHPGSRPCEYFGTGDCCSAGIGPNDHELMLQLSKGGPVHAKYRRMITVTMDITAPLYWWKEFDTYKVGTVANSCSTMHKIHEKEFTIDDFSHEHLGVLIPAEKNDGEECFQNLWIDGTLPDIIEALNSARTHYNRTDDPELKKAYWWQMIQLLPSSYNQKRTVLMNYEVLAGIYPMRKNHKLDEWRDFCHWIEGLPYSEVILPQKPDILTYGAICKKFVESSPFLKVDDYRPYTPMNNSIIVWISEYGGVQLSECLELAVQYCPETDSFRNILGAKKFNDILN